MNRLLREGAAALAFLLPSLLLGVEVAAPVALLGAVLALAVAVVLLGWRLPGELHGAPLPLVLLAAALPALVAPSGPSTAALAALNGVGVLAWIAARSTGPAGGGRRATAVALPGAAAGVALAIALGTPGLSAGPGLPALLLVVVLVLMAFVIVGRPPEHPAAAEAPEAAGDAPTG